MSRIVGYVDEQGVYHKGEDKAMPHDRNTLHKEWDHTMQRKEYHKEIIQPRIDGKPNPAFIRAYPKYSLKYWDQATIDKSLREDSGSKI